MYDDDAKLSILAKLFSFPRRRFSSRYTLGVSKKTVQCLETSNTFETLAVCPISLLRSLYNYTYTLFKAIGVKERRQLNYF